jgi:hypothetical protein
MDSDSEIREYDFVSQFSFILVIDTEENRLTYIEESGISIGYNVREDINLTYDANDEDNLIFIRNFIPGYEDNQMPSTEDDSYFFRSYKLNRITGKLETLRYWKNATENEGTADKTYWSCTKKEPLF